MSKTDVVNNAVHDGILSNLLWNEAGSYIFAAKALVADKQTKSPTYFLLSHALELALKAYLAAHGVKFLALKNGFRHDITTAYREAVEFGLRVEMDFIDAEKIPMLINLLSEFHKDYVFRYPTISPEGHLVVVKTLVQAEQVLQFVDKLWCDVGPTALHARLVAASEGAKYPIEEWHMGRKPNGHK